jgi:NAD+ kinase
MFLPLLSPHKNTTPLQDYIASHPEHFTDTPKNAQAILVAGGDGFMLDSIKKYQSYQLPFIGVNFWTLGFLMNTVTNYDDLPTSLDQYTIITENLPHVTMEDTDGNIHTCNAINDIIIGKKLIDYFSFNVQTETESYTIKGTGLILSTPIGSTAYRHSNGGDIMELDSDTRWLMGIATMPFHHQYLTPQTITIDIQGKQPADIGIDGYSWLHTNITRITIDKTPHQVQLAFLPSQNFHHKRRNMGKQ